jgi:integron integrase
MRFKHNSLRTEQAYRQWIKRFIFFHGKRHPRELGAAEVQSFLSDLASRQQVAVATQNQALNALVFLYGQVLQMELGNLGDIERPARPARLPVVLTAVETQALLAAMSGTHQLMANLLYGSGMRLMEGIRLRVKDVDFALNHIVVREGKGFKDRVTMLPDRLKPDLQRHLERVKLLHAEDLRRGLGAVYLPLALSRKYPNAEREWCWQYVFPAAGLARLTAGKDFEDATSNTSSTVLPCDECDVTA